MNARHAGINVPLFSLRSSQSWGIGEMPDLGVFAEWVGRAGCDQLLLLPIGTMPDGETSPYSARSTVAIDPIYIALDEVPEFRRAGGVAALGDGARAALDAARRSTRIDYAAVRRAKHEALDLAFGVFLADEWQHQTPRAAACAAYVARESAWLDDYALFEALRASQGGRPWLAWPEPLRDRHGAALAEARTSLAAVVLGHQYRQWVAQEQWDAARHVALESGVSLIGDLPFVSATDSPEIWAHADEYRLDVSVGVPPDAFSPTGQDWGLPMYRWDVMAARGYGWLAARARRMASLYDAMRVDHVIGLYRTYGRVHGAEPFFSPAEEHEQIAQGEAVLRTLSASGLSLIAEDLGVVPNYLRPSLARLGMPGCKVLRWERDWHAPGAPFLEPRAFIETSAAMSGTHDTEPVAEWWRMLLPDDRRAFLQLTAFADAPGDADVWTADLRDRYLAMAFDAGSAQVFFPIQDVFGWVDRVNVPGTVGPENWTWAVPFPVDQWLDRPDTRERATVLAGLARDAHRTGRLLGASIG